MIAGMSDSPTEPVATANVEPLDLVWLGSWLQPQHLKSDVIESYREEFVANSSRMLVLKNFLLEPLAFSLSSFVNQEAEVETLFGLYSAMQKNPNGVANVTEVEWQRADERDRFFKLGKFVRVSADKQLTPNFATYLSFLSGFKNPRFRKFFEAITGLTFDLSSETYHFFTFKKGDFLGPHTDRGKDYLLAFMLYLSPEWELRFGGSLNIVRPDGGLTKLEPEYNSLVLFNVEAQAEHFVSRIDECAGDRGRTAFSGWLHKPASEG